MASFWLTVSLMLSADFARIVFADYHSPMRVWPLSNFSRGYEVLTDTKTAELSGQWNFAEGISSSTTSFILSESSSLKIPISDEFSVDFTLSVFFYVERLSGELLHFRDSKGLTIFALWVMNGDLHLDMKISCGASQQIYLSNTVTKHQWVKIIVAKGDSIKLRTNIKGKKEVTCDSSDTEFLPSGDLEIGGAGKYNDVGHFEGRVCCLVMYTGTDTSEYITASERDCTSKDGWAYKGPHPCDFFPCQHGGSCREDTWPQYTCECVSGYTDRNCQTDINDCEPNPCQHQQPCSDEVDGFTCFCEPDFTGSRCEIEMPKIYDDGHYRLESQGAGQDFSKSLSTYPVRSRLGCGQTCVSVPGCRSFTLEPGSSGWMKCTLYTDVFRPLSLSQRMTYYIPKYYTGPLK